MMGTLAVHVVPLVDVVAAAAVVVPFVEPGSATITFGDPRFLRLDPR